MSLTTVTRRIRARAARSPRIRKLAGKPPRYEMPPPGFGDNASAWAIGNESLWPIRDVYGGSFALPPISHGTVRDLADSTATMPGLAGASFDMKDLQRCWMVKAIVGNVEPGSRILEVGAGEPLVAGVLSRLGYQVTVVDSYLGSGNGPTEFEAFKAGYPDLRFVREDFPPREDLGGGYAAVYSISVLEHVPLEAIDAVIGGARALVAETGGHSIHAVDHVLAGWGADSHLEKLERIVTASGLSLEELRATIGELEHDPETYFVSAEAHNRWRGDLPYDRYAMRRICSVNIFAGA